MYSYGFYIPKRIIAHSHHEGQTTSRFDFGCVFGQILSITLGTPASIQTQTLQTPLFLTSIPQQISALSALYPRAFPQDFTLVFTFSPNGGQIR